MIVKDSTVPKKPAEEIHDELYKITCEAVFDRIIETLRKRGYAFPNEHCGYYVFPWVDYKEYRRNCPRCKYVHAFYNNITGRKEMQFTSKAALKTYPQYKGVNLDKWVKEI